MTSYKKDFTRADEQVTPDTLRGKPSLSMIGLLILQMIIGYEWLLSGIAKFASGDFASGLANDLAEAANPAAGWYGSFLNRLIIPNATIFGYIIETAEVLAGIALLVGPLVWIFAWDRLPEGLRKIALNLMITAAIGGIFMALNFHIASGANHPWAIPDSGFDEGVDIDLLLVAIQTVITTVQIVVLSRLRVERTDILPETAQVRQTKHA